MKKKEIDSEEDSTLTHLQEINYDVTLMEYINLEWVRVYLFKQMLGYGIVRLLNLVSMISILIRV